MKVKDFNLYKYIEHRLNKCLKKFKGDKTIKFDQAINQGDVVKPTHFERQYYSKNVVDFLKYYSKYNK